MVSKISKVNSTRLPTNSPSDMSFAGSGTSSAKAQGLVAKRNAMRSNPSGQKKEMTNEEVNQTSKESQIRKLKSDIKMLYKQLEDASAMSPGPNAVTDSPWTEGPRANYATGQMEQTMAQIRVKERQIQMVEKYGDKINPNNRSEYNDLMMVYEQMGQEAVNQDWDPSYKGYGSSQFFENKNVADNMFRLRNKEQILIAQIENS